MARKDIDGIPHYTRRDVHPTYGRFTAYSMRDTLVQHIKMALRGMLVDPPKRRRMYSDWLLAEAAMHMGYEAQDVIEVMGSRPYGLR